MARKNILINSGAAGVREVAENSLNSNFAELYARSGYENILSDTALAYQTEANPSGSVVAGDILGPWEVAASDASDQHATTAGGVKLYEAGPNFSTRARAVAAHARNVAAGRTVPAGTVWSWPDFSIVLMPAGHGAYGTDPIADLAGWAPFGDVYPDHLKENTTPGTTDMRSAIQAAFDYVRGTQPLGGGTVHLLSAVYGVSGPVEVYSDTALKGPGWTQCYIKALDSATFATNEAVIQSVDFPTVQGTDLWDYYSPYPNGLVMGFSIDGVTIDGNRANVANAGGLHIYGGKWAFGAIGVINTSGHGIWTECGIPGSSTSGDDLHDWLNMHESTGRDVYICNADQHGWFYRGPNDSAIDNVQVKTCGWAGFYQESTGNNSVGNLEIGSLHAYSCSCGHAADGAMIDLANANIGFLYSDASLKNGVRFSGSASIVGEIMSLSSNKNNAGAFWGVICDVACQIGMVRNSETTARTTGTDGGLVQINASSTVVGQIRTVQNPSTTISQVGVEINAQCNIGEIIVEAYDSASSVGVLVDSSRVVANINAKNNLLAVDYATAGRNRISIQGEGNTTDIQYTATPSRTDAILVQTDNLSRSERRVGKIIDTALNLDQTDVASASSYTPDASSASYIKISGLAHNITFGAPTNPTRGDVLKIQVQQDGTGGRTITWNSAYKTGYSDTGNTAFTRHVITFVYDGTFWVEQSRSGWF